MPNVKNRIKELRKRVMSIEEGGIYDEDILEVIDELYLLKAESVKPEFSNTLRDKIMKLDEHLSVLMYVLYEQAQENLKGVN